MALHDIESGCSLFHAVFGQPRSPGEWLWKFAEAPVLASTNLVGVGSNGQLVAHVGAQMFEGRWGDQSLRWVQVCDVMVHPQVRGDLGPGNLYRKLMRALDDTLQHLGPASWPMFIYGFPGIRPARLGERMGLYRRLYTCAAQQGGDPPRGLLARWRATQGWRAQAVPWSTLRDPGLAAFWRRAAAPSVAGIGLLKTAAYLDWRYARHPTQRYRLWLLRRTWASPQGWLVTREAGSPEVIDASLPADLPLRQALAALAAASRTGGWCCWLPGDFPMVATPIIAVEISGTGRFHPDWPLPRFQPGDTDVF